MALNRPLKTKLYLHHPQLNESKQGHQRGAVTTYIITLHVVIALLLLTGPYELARATWLLSQCC